MGSIIKSVQALVPVAFCTEHPRVELENGKCIACGDVEYKVKKDMSINMQVAYLALFFIILVLIFAAYSILTQ